MASSARRPQDAAGALLNHRQHPYRSLVVVFGVWKTFLLALAVLATYAGPAYDTSGDLLEAAANGSTASYHEAGHAVPVGGAVSRLTSWDAIYYVQAARRGYFYEQEWAFGAGLPVVVSLLRGAFDSLGIATDVPVPVLAVAVVHVAHLLSVLLLYKLGRQFWLGDTGRTAFVASCLHILSPAGLFLSAPYAESSCALFSFAGYLAFAAARKRDISSASHVLPSFAGDVLRLVAGISFGLATTFRSNGLLNGIVFAYEAVTGTVRFVRQPSLPFFRRLAFLGLGGLSVAAGSVIPQTAAYLQFCSGPLGVPGEDLRPWCKARVPSIYTFVQEHYWGTGLFKYWTLSNLPLFLLATPMLLVLLRSGLDSWAHVMGQKPARQAKKDSSTAVATQDVVFDPRLASLILCMAASQLVLVLLAFTSYHVQIITRLSSGYPVWYWWLAQSLTGGPRSSIAGPIVVFMIMYASIQGILFASFLPPA